MQADKEFPYTDAAVSIKVRVVVTMLLFASAVFFLWRGESLSLADLGGLRLSDDQNLTVNLFSALAFSVLGFLSLFWTWQRATDRPTSVIVSQDRITAPNQGVSGRPVEIRLADITRLQKLSVDGAWEFNVYSPDKHIRVPRAALKVPADFDRLISCVRQMTHGCDLQTEERIDPPRISP